MESNDSEKAISTLNDLIEALKDGENGYQQAAAETKDTDLTAMFGEYSRQRHDFAKVLQKAAFALGEAKPERTGSVSGAIHRGWIDIKSALSTQDRHAILAECERGEDIAVAAYRDALAKGDLDSSIKIVVQEQSEAILEAHNTMKKLRDESAPK